MWYYLYEESKKWYTYLQNRKGLIDIAGKEITLLKGRVRAGRIRSSEIRDRN